VDLQRGADRLARVLASAVLGALVVMGVVAYVALGGGDDPLAAPPAWLVGAQVAAGVLLHLVLRRLGGRSGADPMVVVRMALAEVVAMASLAVAFVRGEGSAGDYVTGAVVSAVLVGLHVWPRERTIRPTA